MEKRFFGVLGTYDGPGRNELGVIVRQEFRSEWRYSADGKTRCRAKLRFDDSCGNGHETFAITGETMDLIDGRWREGSSGCIHEAVSSFFPEFSGLVKWHLCSTDGPMHYVPNTVYLAGDRDCWGLRLGESRQIVNGKTGLPCWVLGESSKLEKYVDAEACPSDTATLSYGPLLMVGEGKERELDLARICAVWPEATDEVLCSDPSVLKPVLLERLPGLIASFRGDMLSFGFEYPESEG